MLTLSSNCQKCNFRFNTCWFFFKDFPDFLDNVLLLMRKLLNQGFLVFKLKSSLRKFYNRHPDLVNCYRFSESQMTEVMIRMSVSQFRFLFSFMTYHRISYRVPLVEQELFTLPGHQKLTSGLV